MKKTTLRELVEEYGANGFVLIDAGNGAAGPAWITWDEEIDDEYGDTEMVEIAPTARAYEDEEKSETILNVAKDIISGYTQDASMYASEWIEDDDRNYEATNPWRYRLLF